MEVFFASKIIRSKGRRDSELYIVSNRFQKKNLSISTAKSGMLSNFSAISKTRLRPRGVTYEREP